MNGNSNFFAILSRMKYVDRWGLMRNSRKESLSDHTLDVVFITHALVVIANTYFGAKLDEGRAALLAASAAFFSSRRRFSAIFSAAA